MDEPTDQFPNNDRRDGQGSPFGVGLDDRPQTDRRKPLGAPIVRAPLDESRKGKIDLLAAAQRANTTSPLNNADASAGGRRSRAFPDESRRADRPNRAFTVVDGDEAEPNEDEEVARTLSPSTLTSLGDLAAALTGPLAAAIYLRSAAVFVASTLLVLLVRAQGRRSALTESEISVMSPVVAGVGAFALSFIVSGSATTTEALTAGGLALGAGAIAALAVKLIADRFVHVRVAVLGEAAAAHDLAWQLSNERIRRYNVVGYVTRTTERDNLRELDHISFKVRRLGLLSDLSHIVARNDIDLLVMSTDQDRLKIFERASVCAERYRTRLLSATAFDEAVFRRVPVEQLNFAWFQHIMHPRFRPVPKLITRVVDVAVAGAIGLLTLPVWGATALFMRSAFGRPVLVHRRRVGERGRSFSVMYFRVARRDVTGGPPDEDVPPVGFGKFLRATRIERLPLLLSVLRGDMSLVGPRPERPQRTSEIERDLSFYPRRNLVRPGLTGWAQIHSTNDSGSAHDANDELSRDLFYLKHQSVMLYAYVLLATISRGASRPFRRDTSI